MNVDVGRTFDMDSQFGGTSLTTDTKSFVSIPPLGDKQIPANGHIFLFGYILVVAIFIVLLSSLIDLFMVEFSKDDDKKHKRKEYLKSYLKTIPVFILPYIIIFFSRDFLDFQTSYIVSGTAVKIYTSSDFQIIACYSAIIAIFSFIMLLCGMIKLFKKKSQRGEALIRNIIWIVLFLVMTILYSSSTIQLMLASM